MKSSRVSPVTVGDFGLLMIRVICTFSRDSETVSVDCSKAAYPGAEIIVISGAVIASQYSFAVPTKP